MLSLLEHSCQALELYSFAVQALPLGAMHSARLLTSHRGAICARSLVQAQTRLRLIIIKRQARGLVQANLVYTLFRVRYLPHSFSFLAKSGVVVAGGFSNLAFEYLAEIVYVGKSRAPGNLGDRESADRQKILRKLYPFVRDVS